VWSELTFFREDVLTLLIAMQTSTPPSDAIARAYILDVLRYIIFACLHAIGVHSIPGSFGGAAAEELKPPPSALPPPALPPVPPPPRPPSDGLAPEQLLAHTQRSFADAVCARLGRGDRLARLLYRAYFAAAGDLNRAAASSDMLAATDLGAALHGLCATRPPLRFAGKDGSATPPPAGATEKFVLVCAGGEEVEMVAMPAPGLDGAWSLCVSSQVGCRMGCTFCETGRMGLLRNLRVDEIVAQVAMAAHELKLRVGNVIFMGMGEPLDNVDNVICAIRILSDPAGLNVPLSHITVSTSGEAQHVYTLIAALPAVRVAFSLHAANEALRSQLMPINRRVSLAELAAAMRRYLELTKQRVTVQYVLLAGVNDSVAHARELAAFLSTIGPAARLHVNLIPYNPQSGPQPRYTTPSHADCKRFKEELVDAKLFVKIREAKGAEKMAACGQLGNIELRRELNRRREAALAYEDEKLAAAPAPVETAVALSCTALAW